MANNEIDILNNPQATKNIFILNFVMTGVEFANWKLYDVQHTRKDTLTTLTEYYWQNTSDESQTVKIDVIQETSWTAGQKAFKDIVLDHMAMKLPAFPPENKKGTPLGDIAFSGTKGLHHLLFVRANMAIVLNSIGTKDIDVSEFAYKLDDLFSARPSDKSTDTKFSPDIQSFELGGKTRAGHLLKFQITDAIQDVWLKLIATEGEFEYNMDGIHWQHEDGRGELTLVATNGRGLSSTRTIKG